MLRRAVLVAAAAVALIFAPSTAMAAPAPNYTAPGYPVTVSDSSPSVNHPIKVNVAGGTAHDRLTLTITPALAGNQGTDTNELNAKGSANYSVHFNEAGTSTLTITHSKVHVVSTPPLPGSAASPVRGRAH